MKARTLICVAIVTASALAGARAGDITPVSGPRPYEFVFKQKCASCHGLDGRGEESMYRKLNVKEGSLDLTRKEIIGSTDQDLETTIRLGKGKMPSFERKFHEDVIYGLAKYVRSLTQAVEEVRGTGQPQLDKNK